MTRIEKGKVTLAVFAVVLVLLVLGYGRWQPAEGEMDEIAAQQPPPSGTAEIPFPQVAEAGTAESGRTIVSAAQRDRTGAPNERGRMPPEVTVPPGVPLNRFKAELWDEVQANPPELAHPGDPEIDADMAYRLYMYFGNCSMAPRTGPQVDKQLDRIVDRAERARGRYLEGLEGRADRILDYYELCLPIPPEVDRRMEAVIWMTEAVRLGHEVAQVQFYEKAMGFLMREDRYMNIPPLAMQYPGMVAEFKETARFAFSRALEKGHPEAYLAKSQAVIEGMIYPKDPVMAYALALRAESEAAKNRTLVGNVDHWKRAAAQYLSQDQIAEARQLALEMDTS